jgi:acetoin utilization deacetylase AcuC-like enzyme
MDNLIQRQSSTGLVADAFYKHHLTGRAHPEQPARYDAVMQGLAKIEGSLVKIEARPAEEDELLLCHTPDHAVSAKQRILAGEPALDGGDTMVCPESWDAALLAAGGVLNAVDAVVEGKVRNAFCVVRPPGHHACADRAMGFCILNNIAIAARYAQQKHKLGKVLVVDWDVHHGNGTQDIFYEDGSVFFFSTHQWPWYPGTGSEGETGRGEGEGTTLNRPLPAGSGMMEIRNAILNELVPAADAFRPDIVLVSAGFDSRVNDPLGSFTLTDADFVELTGIVTGIARKHCSGRLVSVLEGGYNLNGLASAAAHHVEALKNGV